MRLKPTARCPFPAPNSITRFPWNSPRFFSERYLLIFCSQFVLPRQRVCHDSPQEDQRGIPKNGAVLEVGEHLSCSSQNSALGASDVG
eukprot:2604171-Rhodomonas_salina.2